MTSPIRRPRRRGRNSPTVTPAQLLAAGLVLAVFVTGLVVGGVVGAVLVGILALAAGALLILRWRVLSGRVRLVRAFVVLIALAVAISLLWR